MDLRCRKTICKFNNKFTCLAKTLDVSEKMVCEVYEKGDKKAVDATKYLFDRVPEYAPQRDSKTCCITCKAHCMFNNETKCIANGITINSVKEKPCCMTYVRK